MTVANPREVPEYELNPLELQIRRSDGIKARSMFSPFIFSLKRNNSAVLISSYILHANLVPKQNES